MARIKALRGLGVGVVQLLVCRKRRYNGFVLDPAPPVLILEALELGRPIVTSQSKKQAGAPFYGT